MHAFYRLCERTRDSYNDENKAISNVKNILLKAPNRINILKEMYSSLEFPPDPVITRWQHGFQLLNIVQTI